MGSSGNPTLISIPRSDELFGAEPGSGPRILSPEVLEGTIEWDEENDGEYTWEELGNELMTYEGFRITIKMG